MNKEEQLNLAVTEQIAARSYLETLMIRQQDIEKEITKQKDKIARCERETKEKIELFRATEGNAVYEYYQKDYLLGDKLFSLSHSGVISPRPTPTQLIKRAESEYSERR